MKALLAYDELIKSSRRTAATAITFCGWDVVKILVNAGIDLRGTLPDNESVFHCIANKDSFSKANLVFTSCAKNAQVLNLNWQGMTPLEMAISNECNANILEMMCKNVSWLRLKLIIWSIKPTNLTFERFVKRLGVRSWLNHFIHSDERDVLNRSSHYFYEKTYDVRSDKIYVITETDMFALTEKDTKSTIFKNVSKIKHLNSVLIVKHCEYLGKMYGFYFEDVSKCALKIAKKISQGFRNKQKSGFYGI